MAEACEPTEQEWPAAFSDAAEAEGWNFCVAYRENITLEIQKIDEQGKFKSDQDAIQHIRLAASFGSDMHTTALNLLKKYNPEEFKRRMI